MDNDNLLQIEENNMFVVETDHLDRYRIVSINSNGSMRIEGDFVTFDQIAVLETPTATYICFSDYFQGRFPTAHVMLLSKQPTEFQEI